jgi:hypothetical protein
LQESTATVAIVLGIVFAISIMTYSISQDAKILEALLVSKDPIEIGCAFGTQVGETCRDLIQFRGE